MRAGAGADLEFFGRTGRVTDEMLANYPLSDAKIFALLFACFALYFSGVMIRLMLVLAPIACVMGGIAVSAALRTYSARIKSYVHGQDQDLPILPSIAFMVTIVILLAFYSYHAVWVSDIAYSSPSIVLAQYTKTGRVLYDDYREAYMWLRRNTAEDARVMSWWDYGYQLGMMANRTTLVDNNTWNNTHIATVGRAMASSEASAYKIMRQLDVDYVLVIFGGVIGFSSDDINKFLWCVVVGGVGGGCWLLAGCCLVVGGVSSSSSSCSSSSPPPPCCRAAPLADIPHLPGWTTQDGSDRGGRLPVPHPGEGLPHRDRRLHGEENSRRRSLPFLVVLAHLPLPLNVFVLWAFLLVPQVDKDASNKMLNCLMYRWLRAGLKLALSLSRVGHL